MLQSVKTVFDHDATALQGADRSTDLVGLAAPDPHYYPVEQLDVLPTPRRPITVLRATAAPASVRLLTRVDASGRVTGVFAFDSNAADERQRQAREALLDTPFRAARKDGRPVRSEVVIELRALSSG